MSIEDQFMNHILKHALGSIRKCVGAVLLGCIFCANFSMAGNLGAQFIRADLQYGASIDIPRSWRVLKGTEMQSIETAVGAAIDLSGYSKVLDGAETLLASNSGDRNNYAGIAITTTKISSVTPRFAEGLSDAQVKTVEVGARQGVESIHSRMGVKIYGWTSMQKVSIGSRIAMKTSYLRKSEEGERRVHMYKFFGMGRMYDLALSTNLDGELLNNVVLEKIVQSFSIDKK
ncbi:MAG: hypothetical protein ACKOWD_02485 [Rhodoferax sp.]